MTDTPRWLIIPVEVMHRELNSRILLSALAAERGFKILLGYDRMIRKLTPTLPKGIIFDKSLGLARHGKPQKFQKQGHKVVVMDEESTGFYGSPDRILFTRLSEKTLEACDRWYCLSEILSEAAGDVYPNHADKFLISGLLRTDLWRKEFHALYSEEVARIKKTHGRFILFNSNFGALIHAHGKAFVDKQIRGQKSAYGGIGANMEHMIAQGRENLDIFVGLLPKLRDWFADHKLIIRPHPSEDITFWQKLCAQTDGIEIVTNTTATPWILASSIMLHHGCTTGIEAEILGQPHVMYAPRPDDHHETETMAAFAEIVKSETDLLRFMRENIDTHGKSTKPQSEKDKWFASLGGTLSAEKVLDDLESLAFPSTDLSTDLPLTVRTRIWFAGNKLQSKKNAAYSSQKWPGTTLENVKDSLQLITRGLKISDDFDVTEPFDQVWQITRPG